jgi:hypothetical protein
MTTCMIKDGNFSVSWLISSLDRQPAWSISSMCSMQCETRQFRANSIIIWSNTCGIMLETSSHLVLYLNCNVCNKLSTMTLCLLYELDALFVLFKTLVLHVLLFKKIVLIFVALIQN